MRPNTAETDSMSNRIFLSPPTMGQRELEYLQNAFESNYIAPVGPFIGRFESAVQKCLESSVHCVALNSGTAALHLALIDCGIKAGDHVIVPSFNFAAGAFAVRYCGATPVFVDAESCSWNLCPDLLEKSLLEGFANNRPIKAVMSVDLYGNSCNYKRIKDLCSHFSLPLIQDAAEALGARWENSACGSQGDYAALSFNGNKITTTGGGGILVCREALAAQRALKRSTQSKEALPYYEHLEIGYNYRLCNLNAAIGLAQVETLQDKVSRRRLLFDAYRSALEPCGLKAMPIDVYGTSNCWLSCFLFPRDRFPKGTPERVRLKLEALNIESRRLWKPLHLQPVFADCPRFANGVSEDLFDCGICLPSGTNLTNEAQNHVIDNLYALLKGLDSA